MEFSLSFTIFDSMYGLILRLKTFESLTLYPIPNKADKAKELKRKLPFSPYNISTLKFIILSNVIPALR